MDINDFISGVDVETRYTPELSVSLAPTPGPSLAATLKPKITIHFKNGISPLVLAPYGDPSPSEWPAIQTAISLGGVALIGLLTFGAVSLFKRKK